MPDRGPAAEGTPRSGDTIGRYRLRQVIGRGGMGVVYQADDLQTGRPVALKLLSPHLSADPDYVRRFNRERQIAAKIENGHVVPVYDFGAYDGRLYIAMRFVPGGMTLAHLLKQGPLAPAVAVGVVSQIASALDAAHSRGVVHLDVKPDNVLLDGTMHDGSGPRALLTDFGIARTAEQQTSVSAVVGTRRYMAPERFSGQWSARTDTYSLACILYEVLTAAHAFPQAEEAQIIFAHLNDALPAPASQRADVSPAMDAVIAHGLAVDPSQRYASSGALAAAARAALAPRSQPDPNATNQFPGGIVNDLKETEQVTRPHKGGAPTSTRRRRRRLLVSLIAVLLVVAGAFAAWLTQRHSNSGDHQAAAKSNTRQVNTAAAGTAATSVAGSPSDRSPGSRPEPAVAAIGDCLDASAKPATCAAAHTYEVYSTSSGCTYSGLLTYLGGQSGNDTLVPAVSARQAKVGGRSVCLVVGPSASLTGSAHDILQTSAGDGWRRCVDVNGTTRVVGCNGPHTAEYVYSGTPPPGHGVNCTAEAGTYLNAAFANFADQLTLETDPQGTTVACVIVVRGGDVLTASVHGIGTDTLPLSPR